MDINRMDEATLTMTQRPKILSHLKQSTLKFQGSMRDTQPQKQQFLKKVLPYMQTGNFRSNSYNTGMKPGGGSAVVRRSGYSEQSSFMPLAIEGEWGQIASELNDRAASKKLKEHYEYANKSHLTSAPGQANSPDYKSMHTREFSGVRDFD